MRSSNRIKTEIIQDSNLLRYLRQQAQNLPKRNSANQRTIINSSFFPAISPKRSTKQRNTIWSNHLIPLKIDSIIEENESNTKPFRNNNRCDLIANCSYLATLGTTDYSSRNIPLSSSPFEDNDIDFLRNSLRRLTKKKTTKLLQMPIKKRSVFKNSEDLFHQVLNIQHNNKKQTTKQLLFKTQIRLLNRHQSKKINENKIPIFNTTEKLNTYLISHYSLDSNHRENNSKRKMEISDETYRLLMQQKKKEIAKQNNTPNMLDFISNSLCDYNEEDGFPECNNLNINNQTVSSLINKYYSNRQNEKIAKGNKFLKKLEDLSYHQYQHVDKFNLISYSNLSRVIKVMKIKEDTFPILKKNRLKMEENKVIIAINKLGHPSNTKAKMKSTTEKKFRSIQGVYFGVPV